MLWLCLHFPRLPAEALGLRDSLAAVTEQRGAQRWLITATPMLAAGTPLASALSLQPTLRAEPRRRSAEQAMLQGLAHALYRYGSPVCIELREFDEACRAPLALLWIEIAASLKLFGGLTALRNAISADLTELEHAVQLAVAPTRAAAALFALQKLPGTVRAAQLDAALGKLPITALPWPAALHELADGLGLRSLAELFALPRGAFTRRFGTAALRELGQLRGQVAEPAEAIVPPARFCRRFELLAEVDSVEALSFALRRLTLELQHWLRARDLGARAVRLACEHARRRRSVCTLHYGESHRDAKRFFDTLRERLGRAPLAGAVRALQLEALELGPADIVQRDLFDANEGGLHWRATLERIAARLGDDALWTPALGDEHRPERAQNPRSESAGDAPASARQRPLWLLDTPRALPPQIIDERPERIESGWWDGEHQTRDYYWHDGARGRGWIFRDRRSEQWFLHGLDG